MECIALARSTADAIEGRHGGPLAILSGIRPGDRATDVVERLEAAVLHVYAVEALGAAKADAAMGMARLLNDEIERWNRVGWPAAKARMWAALEWWVTEDDVMHMGRWLLNGRVACDWTVAETAEVAAAMLDGWNWRLTQCR